MKIRIFSIFNSISGEVAIWPQGTPTTFIRFSGCNLKCGYCDTPDSINGGGVNLSIKEIIERISEYKCQNIMITGGEPLLQSGALNTLFFVLKALDYRVCVETNGSYYIDTENQPDCWIIDVKMPGSGQFEKMIDPGLFFQIKGRTSIILKFPIESTSDFEHALSIYEKIRTPERTIAFSAVSPMTPSALWNLMIQNDLMDVVLNTQVHKYIWPDAKKEC